MGLDTTHDCWSGPYSSFNRFREAIAFHLGFRLRDMEGFGGSTRWSTLPPDPLHVLLNHSDCDGTIEVKDLLPLAERLEAIAPSIMSQHAAEALRFARGLREAAVLQQPVEFQ